MRLAIGASRRQIVTQALVESVLLAIAGGIAGLLVAAGAARLLLVARVPQRALPADQHAAVAAGARLRVRRSRCVTGIIFGAAPAWFATRTDPVDALRGVGPQHAAITRRSRARRCSIVQATLSVVLVAGATMLARSLNKLEHQDFGYQVAGSRRRRAEPAAGDLHAAASWRRCIASSRSA